jgi:hypothetical protein
MNRRIRNHGIVALATIPAMTSAAGASGAEPSSRLAGPWYTAAELKALIAYANATPAERRVLLTGGAQSLRKPHAHRSASR